MDVHFDGVILALDITWLGLRICSLDQGEVAYRQGKELGLLWYVAIELPFSHFVHLSALYWSLSSLKVAEAPGPFLAGVSRQYKASGLQYEI